jgi:hypothetical protein
MTTIEEIETSRKPALFCAIGAVVLAAVAWQSTAWWLGLIALFAGLTLAATLTLLSAIPRDADEIAARYFAELAASNATPGKPDDNSWVADAHLLAI